MSALINPLLNVYKGEKMLKGTHFDISVTCSCINDSCLTHFPLFVEEKKKSPREVFRSLIM